MLILTLAMVAAACGSSTTDAATAITVDSADDDAGSTAAGEGQAEAGAGAPQADAEPTANADGGATNPDEGGQPAPPTTVGDESAPSTEQGNGGPASTASASADPEAGTVRPAWLGTRILATNADGSVPPQATPPEMETRRFPTVDILPAPTNETFTATVEPMSNEVLARSTWTEGCPVSVDELRYLKMTFWGFDGRSHQGEMIVHRDVADDVVDVFRSLHAARFPIEEMRVTAPAELGAPPTGDGNNTTSFVCRAVTGGSRFSEHAYGLAIDVNPFQNPYRKGDVVLPELATSYLDRNASRPGMIYEGDAVVAAFDAIGWGWGGRWQSLDDYHHFSRDNR